MPNDTIKKCKINGNRDLACIGGMRDLIGKECEVIKITRSGLYQVRLLDNIKKIYSLPKYNLDFING